jgi:predicted TIM-barrel fold metal-dependent hydrolase
MTAERLERMKGRIIDVRLRPPTGPYRVFFQPRTVNCLNGLLGFPAPLSYRTSLGSEPDADDRAIEILLKEMDSVGVRLGLMNGRHAPLRGIQITDEYMAGLSTRTDSRLRALAGVDLERPMEEILHGLEVAIKDLKLLGVCVEPGYARNPLHVDDARLLPIYRKVAELKVPLLFMTGPFAGPDQTYTEPARFERVAKQFPEMPVVLGHGCYPFVTEAIALAYNSEMTGATNVFLSPDVYMFAPGGQAYAEGLNWMPDRFLYGSAYSFCGVDSAVRLTANLPISDKALPAYMYENAQRVFGIDSGK